MDSSTLFRVVPTFPVDDQRLRQRRRLKFWLSPVTIGALVGATAVGLLAGAEVIGFLLLYGLAAAGLRWFWLRQQSQVDALSVRELINESNAEQDREMRRIIDRLDQKQLPQYALCLGRFLLLKQKIEKELHRSPQHAAYVAEIEKLVDGVCAEVCREITMLCDRTHEVADVLTSRDDEALDRLESAHRRSHASILHAYTTLYQTHAELLSLDQLTRPEALPPPLAAADETRLDQLVDGLRDEAEFIARTRERISGTLMDGDAELVTTPPPLVSE